MKIQNQLMRSALFVLALSFMSFSALEARGRQGDSEERFQKLEQELDLSDEQKEQFKQLREKHKSKMKEQGSRMKELRSELKESRKKLREQMQSEASNSQLKSEFKKLQELKSQVHKEKSEMSELRFEHALEVRDILTPEQRKNFKGFMQERKKRGKRGRSRDWGGRDEDED